MHLESYLGFGLTQVDEINPGTTIFRTSEEIIPVRLSVLLLDMAGVHNKH